MTSTGASRRRKLALAIRHVAFEDLGSLLPLLRKLGYSVRYVDATDGIFDESPLSPDLVVVLGGPVGVYEHAAYPFLNEELRYLERRLQAELPVVGICLGAQLIAGALGARVYRGHVKEIGWAPVALTGAGRNSPLCHLENTSVLHWHGDSFDIPHGGKLLASTDAYVNQAFSWGVCALAMQFHIEVTAAALERWYVGHACEIAAAQTVCLNALRIESETFAPLLRPRAEEVLTHWMHGIQCEEPELQ